MSVVVDSMIRIHDPDPDLLAFVIEKNTFDNPAQAEALRQGRSTWCIPSHITTYDESADGVLTVPRGFLAQLIRYRLALSEFEDRRICAPVTMPGLEGVALREYQTQAIETAYKIDQGIVQAPTGSGKTIMGLSLIHRKQQRALILVHSKELASQWRKAIKNLMDVDAGMIGGGKWDKGDRITICMIQTLSRNELPTHKMAEHYGLVLVDECHHVPAQSFAQVIGWIPCKYRYGLTATPERRDGLHVLIHRAMGRTLTSVSLGSVQKAGGVVCALITVVSTGCQPEAVKDWNDFLQKIISDNTRNHALTILTKAQVQSCPTLVLTERIEHAETLAKLATENGLEPVLAHGQMSTKARKKAMEAMATARLTIGTTGLLGEGLDVSVWGTLILATPISGRVRLLQAIGRVIRPHPGKTHGQIIDLVDNHPLSQSSFKKRRRVYQERGYSISTSKAKAAA